ncbi:MAG: hypothetical protein CW716_11300 [Candidatus Bathyarchaeum sp.]|nr:MAG: hypothetical protein CW716_11300 [Candidatus Bathyarchaeum sp.]
MKQKIYCLALISALIISITIPLIVSAKTTDDSNDLKGLRVHVDASELLKELGYAEKDMANISRKLMIQICRSYNVIATINDDDGEYYATITPESPTNEVNLIGSDRITPYEFDLSNPPDSSGHYANSSNKSTESFSITQTNERACLVFAIWNYPGIDQDVAMVEDAYDAISGWISSVCPYDYWHFMTNSDCTHYLISAWITWACAAYDDVDVYWIGHGLEFLSDTAFLSYDAWEADDSGVITANLYIEEDFETDTYDFSTLRLGVGSFCFAEGF